MVLTAKQKHWLDAHLSPKETVEVMRPFSTLMFKCNTTGLLLGGLAGIGSSFLLKRRDAPRLFGVPRRFVSFGAFWLGCGVGVISVMAFLLEPCIAEQELIEAKLYRKYKRREEGNNPE